MDKFAVYESGRHHDETYLDEDGKTILKILNYYYPPQTQGKMITGSYIKYAARKGKNKERIIETGVIVKGKKVFSRKFNAAGQVRAEELNNGRSTVVRYYRRAHGMTSKQVYINSGDDGRYYYYSRGRLVLESAYDKKNRLKIRNVLYCYHGNSFILKSMETYFGSSRESVFNSYVEYDGKGEKITELKEGFLSQNIREAVIADNEAYVKEALDSGVRVSSSIDSPGITLLMLAAKHGAFRTASLLIKNGELQKPGGKYAKRVLFLALANACKFQSLRIFLVLFNAGIDPFTVKIKGKPALETLKNNELRKNITAIRDRIFLKGGVLDDSWI